MYRIRGALQIPAYIGLMYLSFAVSSGLAYLAVLTHLPYPGIVQFVSFLLIATALVLTLFEPEPEENET